MPVVCVDIALFTVLWQAWSWHTRSRIPNIAPHNQLIDPRQIFRLPDLMCLFSSLTLRRSIVAGSNLKHQIWRLTLNLTRVNIIQNFQTLGFKLPVLCTNIILFKGLDRMKPGTTNLESSALTRCHCCSRSINNEYMCIYFAYIYILILFILITN